MGSNLKWVYGGNKTDLSDYLKVRPKFFHRADVFFKWIFEADCYELGIEEAKIRGNPYSLERVKRWNLENGEIWNNYDYFIKWSNFDDKIHDISQNLIESTSFHLSIDTSGIISYSHPLRPSRFIEHFELRYYQRRIAYFWARLLELNRMIYMGSDPYDGLLSWFTPDGEARQREIRKDVWSTLIQRFEQDKLRLLDLHKALSEEEMDEIYYKSIDVYFIDTFEDLVEEKAIMDALDEQYAEEEALWTPELGWP